MDEVHFNKAKITHVNTAELWPEKKFLFRGALLKLFAMRVDAKKKLILAFAESLKILMNGGGGKFGQALIDIVHIIIDIENYNEVIDYYRKGQVCFHDLLANGKEYLVELHKSRLPKVEIPSHLYAFILSYGRHHVIYVLMLLAVLIIGRIQYITQIRTQYLFGQYLFITINTSNWRKQNYLITSNFWMKVSSDMGMKRKKENLYDMNQTEKETSRK